MPIYTYKCESCQKEFDDIVLNSNPPIKEKVCPFCINGVAKRVIMVKTNMNAQYLTFDRVGS